MERAQIEGPRPSPDQILRLEDAAVCTAGFASSKEMVVVRETPGIVFERHSVIGISVEQEINDDVATLKRKRSQIDAQNTTKTITQTVFEGTAVIHTIGSRDVPVARPKRLEDKSDFEDKEEAFGKVNGNGEKHDVETSNVAPALALSLGRDSSACKCIILAEEDGAVRKRRRATPSSLVTVLEQALQTGEMLRCSTCALRIGIANSSTIQ